jgi:hypothetical protein
MRNVPAFVGTELLDEKVISRNGPWQRIRRWWRGIHPDRGVVIHGWTGWETVEEIDRLVPIHQFYVAPRLTKAA